MSVSSVSSSSSSMKATERCMCGGWMCAAGYAATKVIFRVALQGLMALVFLPLFCIMYGVEKWLSVYFREACAWATRWTARAVLYVLDITVPQQTIDLWRSWVERRLRIIVLFPHSSLWDSFLQIVIAVAYDLPGFGMAHACWEKHWIVGPFLRLCGGGSILFVHPRVDGGQGGATLRVTEQLLLATADGSGLPEGLSKGFVFWISPTGGRIPRPWRSGFYQIGLNTGASFATGGIDYHTRTFCLHSALIPYLSGYRDLSKEEVTEDLVPRFCSITPLNPLLSFPDKSQFLDRMPRMTPDWLLYTHVYCGLCLALAVVGFCLQNLFDAVSSLRGPL